LGLGFKLDSGKKTIFFVSISFVISITIFFGIMVSLPDYVYEQHKEFYSQTLPKNKIFIFGSSQTYPINPILVSDDLNQEGHNYTVYHLGQGSFDPEERLRTSDLVISQKPDIVIYGIAYQTFYSHGRNIIEKPSDSFTSPPRISDLLSTIPLPVNTGLIDNPKFATINTVNHITSFSEKELIRPYPNTPFFVILGNEGIPAEKKDLEEGGKLSSFKGMEIYPISDNRTYSALKKLIHKFNDNDIQVVVFTTPHHKNWLKQLPIEQKQIFESMLEDLEKEFDFKVFRLHDKYDKPGLWTDHDHLIAFDKRTDFYSHEISRILLTTIGEQ